MKKISHSSCHVQWKLSSKETVTLRFYVHPRESCQPTQHHLYSRSCSGRKDSFLLILTLTFSPFSYVCFHISQLSYCMARISSFLGTRPLAENLIHFTLGPSSPYCLAAPKQTEFAFSLHSISQGLR